MTFPQVTVTSGTGGRPPGDSIDTGTAFVAGPVVSGPTLTATRVSSVSQFDALSGGVNATHPLLRATLDRAFRQGLETAYYVGIPDLTSATAVADALAAFPARLGCGQVYVPDATADADLALIAQHAAANNRTAVFQVDGTWQQRVDGLARLRGLGTNPEVSAAFVSPLVVPDGSGGRATSRLAADALGLIARADGIYGNAGNAAAGDQEGRGIGRIVDCYGVAETLTDGQWSTLYDGGGNVAIATPTGDVELYGFRSLSPDPMWQQLTQHRLRMQIVSLGRALLGQYLFETIDGQGLLFERVKETLTNAIFMPLWNAGVLYGATPADAFTVDTSYGDGRVNTPATVAARRLRAAGRYVPSGFAEAVEFEINAEPIA